MNIVSYRPEYSIQIVVLSFLVVFRIVRTARGARQRGTDLARRVPRGLRRRGLHADCMRCCCGGGLAGRARRPERRLRAQPLALAAKPRAERSSAKRGALCVDALDPHPPPPAASAAGRDHHHAQSLRQGSQKLLAEAMTVISKLLIVDASTGAAAAADAPAEPPKRQKLDPRLQNLDFVRAAALRRYARECSAGTARLNVAVLHDVCVHANEFVRKQRRLAEAATAAPSAASAGARPQERAATAGHVRERIARLIVSLWRATCATPPRGHGAS